jgi:hypothetical protein
MREKEREREREEEEREVIYSKIWRNNSWPSWERDGISRQRHASDRLEKERETNKSSFSASCDLIIDRRDRETDRQTSKETGKQTDRPQKGEGRTMKRRQRERERNRARDTDRERERERERERKKPKKRERDREREKSAKSERQNWPVNSKRGCDGDIPEADKIAIRQFFKSSLIQDTSNLASQVTKAKLGIWSEKVSWCLASKSIYLKTIYGNP